MTMLIIFILLVVVYIIACILDGPDFKEFWRHWTVSEKWRYVHYENGGNKCVTVFHMHLGGWRAQEDPNIVKDKVHILPFISYYYNSSEVYVGVGWLIFEAYFFTMYYNKREQVIRRVAES